MLCSTDAKAYCSKNDGFHLSQFASIQSCSFLKGSLLSDATLAIMNSTHQGHVWSPKHQKLIFSLASNCKNKPALDDPLQESPTASKEHSTAPLTQNHIKLKS